MKLYRFRSWTVSIPQLRNEGLQVHSGRTVLGMPFAHCLSGSVIKKSFRGFTEGHAMMRALIHMSKEGEL